MYISSLVIVYSLDLATENSHPTAAHQDERGMTALCYASHEGRMEAASHGNSSGFSFENRVFYHEQWEF